MVGDLKWNLPPFYFLYLKAIRGLSGSMGDYFANISII